MRSKLITVIVPCWNYGMFLRECLNSLLAQTVLPAKIIIANDCSTDDSHDIAQEYLDFYPGQFVLMENTERLGTIANENQASEYVGTPWMFYLDADDKLDKTYIEKCEKIINESDDNLMVVYSDMMKFGLWEGVWPVADWDPEALRSGNYINGHSVFRTGVFRAIGKLKEGPGFEDHQMWVDMMDFDKAFYGVHIPEPLVWYRRHDRGHRTDKTDLTTRA